MDTGEDGDIKGGVEEGAVGGTSRDVNIDGRAPGSEGCQPEGGGAEGENVNRGSGDRECRKGEGSGGSEG